MGKCNWLTAEQLITVSVLKTIHAVVTTGKPRAIYGKFKFNRRSTANINIKRFPKCKQGQDFYLNKGLKIYNKLPADLKQCNKKQFKNKIVKYLKSDYSVP